ncbi:hypothetical protein [Proteus mirabilis]|uniref:hypothetical protein n=1 Tax=Proteus mirabilis TaxID=584 RepID=UPI0024E0E499|nr:hypothetical protein [Proteus mirabilis]
MSHSKVDKGIPCDNRRFLETATVPLYRNQRWSPAGIRVSAYQRKAPGWFLSG